MLVVTRFLPLEGSWNMLYPRLTLVAQRRPSGAVSETVPKVQSPSSRALAPRPDFVLAELPVCAKQHSTPGRKSSVM
eukprot:s2239_g9.t1